MSQQQGSDGVARIVVGVDGSPSSKDALRWAVRQAGLTGATVAALITWHLPQFTGTGGYAWPPVGGPETTELARLAEKVLTDAITETGAAEGLAPITAQVRQGHAAQALLEAAAEADLLVVGSRGHGGFAEALLGSVSQRCVQHAPCPVVIVRAAPSAGRSRLVSA
jgi:nucleotide-binding universal stress UspA family protein